MLGKCFSTAFVGIEVEGAAYRMDGVPLPLKKVVDPPKGILSDETILRTILEEVRAIKSGKPAGIKKKGRKIK
jgi:formylmethanofuran dehydrogenase subunit B